VQPDVLHMDEEAYNLATLEGFLMAQRAGARSLFFTWQNLLRRYPPPFAWIERYCHARAAGAICGNAEAVDVLRQKGYAGPTWVIPQFGVDPDLFRPLPEVRPPGQPFTVGFCGRLRERKGELLLIRAMAALGGDARLEILGWGEAAPRVRALAAELGIAERVRIHGAMPSTEVPGFLNRLDVLAAPSLTLPSWKEQFGRVLMEAMACGVPVVGSRSGEIAHVIGDAGLLFPEGDVPALGERLRRLRDDAGLRRDLGERGLARVRMLYTQQRIAEQTVAAYREILER
jgi:glycosyltransferase involved in cell wall biosynthesis